MPLASGRPRSPASLHSRHIMSGSPNTGNTTMGVGAMVYTHARIAAMLHWQERTMDDQSQDAIARKIPAAETLGKTKSGKGAAKKKRRTAKRAPAVGKKTAWTFPQNTLEDAIRDPKVIE